MRVYEEFPVHHPDDTPRLNRAAIKAAGHVFRPMPASQYAGIYYAHFAGKHNVICTDHNRTIMLYEEPPVVATHQNIYRHPEEFYATYTLSGINNTPLVTLDPIAYPYAPDTHFDVIRSDAQLKTRGIFYRGGQYHKWPRCDYFDGLDLGSQLLYGTRVHLVEGLTASGKFPMDVAGYNWGRSTYDLKTWVQIKRMETAETFADFHLCCENTRMRGYISEKIHHGFQSDLVVLYLGNPYIHEYVPEDAFINLNRYYCEETQEVDIAAVVDLLASMPPEEYRRRLDAARTWRRESRLNERNAAARERMTNEVIRLLADLA